MNKYLIITLCLLASPATAETVARIPGKIVLSQELVEAVFQRLSQDPYASVAPLLAKMQAEAASQLAQPVPASAPPPDAKPEK